MSVSIVLLVLCAVVIGIPLGLWTLYQWLRRKEQRRLAVLVPALLLLGLAYPAYTALYPADDFYQAEFTRVTHLPFPASGDIRQQNVNLPDQHGAYTACARISLSPADFRHLQQQLAHDSAFHPKGSISYSFLNLNGGTSLSPGPTDSIYQAAFSGGYSAYGFVGFLRDGCTIILFRHRS